MPPRSAESTPDQRPDGVASKSARLPALQPLHVVPAPFALTPRRPAPPICRFRPPVLGETVPLARRAAPRTVRYPVPPVGEPPARQRLWARFGSRNGPLLAFAASFAAMITSLTFWSDARAPLTAGAQPISGESPLDSSQLATPLEETAGAQANPAQHVVDRPVAGAPGGLPVPPVSYTTELPPVAPPGIFYSDGSTGHAGPRPYGVFSPYGPRLMGVDPRQGISSDAVIVFVGPVPAFIVSKPQERPSP